MCERWALTNPHVSVHIPSESRISVSTQRKSNGQPRRPLRSLASVLANLHLLLRVPSFVRWPLRLHIFNREVYRAWLKACQNASGPLRPDLEVATSFRNRSLLEKVSKNGQSTEVREGDDVDVLKTVAEMPGIHTLPLDYEPIRDYVAKGQEIFEFERQGKCVVCHEDLVPFEKEGKKSKGKGKAASGAKGGALQAVCSNPGCDAVGHLTCWSRHLIESSGEADSGCIIPIRGQCPKCNGEVLWGDMMKELTLRVRGKVEVEKLLKRKRRGGRSKKAKQSSSEEDG